MDYWRPMQVTAVAANGKFIELTDLVGRRFYLKKTGFLGTRLFEKHVFVDPSETPHDAINTDYREPPRDFTVSSAHQLALDRIQNSSTWQAEIDGNKKSEIFGRVQEAYTDMLRHLKSGKPLTLELVQRWNRMILRTQETAPDKVILNYLDGLVRGTEEIVSQPQGTFLIDLNGVEAPVEYIVNLSVFTMRPEAVPHALAELIAHINRIGPESTFADAAVVMRRFLRIHPHVDACGRTGILLMDYALMKAGFSPPAGIDEKTPILLWTTEAEAIRNIAGKYDGG